MDVPYTGRPDEFRNLPAQKSRPVALQAGEVVLLQAAHCQSHSGPALLQVSGSSEHKRCLASTLEHASLY